jgi:predicted DNA-binding transcriptional regulator AlpA
MDSTIADDGRILTEEELDALTGVSATTRWRERRAGRFPPLLELSPGRRGNTVGQIRKWKAERHAAAEARAKTVQDPQTRKPGRPRKTENSAEGTVE